VVEMMFYNETNFGGETVIGRIPMGWKVVRIGEICEFKRGFSYRSDQITEDATNTRFFTINDYEKEGGLKHNGERLYLKDEVNVDSDFILNKDDVLIANTDMSRGFIIGAPIHIESVEGKLVYSMDSTKLIFDKNEIDGKFLFYLLKHEKVRRKMKTFAQGTNVLHLNHELVKSLRIPLPSLSEQRGIVGVLGVVDEAIQKTDELIANTERLKKGLMQTLLTKGIGHKEFKDTEIGRIPKEWKIEKIGDACKVVTGGTPSTKHPEYFGGKIKWLKSGDIKRLYIYDTEEKITELGIENSNAKIHPANSVAIALSGRGQTRGRTTIIKEPMACSQSVAIMIPNSDLQPEYLHYNLSNRYMEIRNLTGDLDRSGLNLSIVSNIVIPIPPFYEQEKIASVLTTIESKLELERDEKGRLERIKSGLMDLLLTGKIRIKVD
jgi:type I restriction enzyme S subunit